MQVGSPTKRADTRRVWGHEGTQFRSVGSLRGAGSQGLKGRDTRMGTTATAVPRAWSNGSYAAIHRPATGPMILSAGPPGLLPPGHARGP
eukprot:806666-Rhodomonas_salina.1